VLLLYALLSEVQCLSDQAPCLQYEQDDFEQSVRQEKVEAALPAANHKF